MAAWVAHAGAGLLIPSGPGLHLFVAVNDPVPFEGYGSRMVVLVNFSTIRPNLPFDGACVAEPGDHPFITARSFVRYRDARIEQARHIEHCVASGVYRPQQDASADLLMRIRAGFQASRLVSREIRRLAL